LFQADTDVTVLGFVALRLLHKRVLSECLLYVTGIDIHHRLGQWVELLFLQNLLNLIRIEEAVGHLVVDVNFHLRTHGGSFSGLVERCDSQYEISGDDDIKYDDDGLFSVE
jgi:hypothetical protein